MYIFHTLFICPSIDGHLGHFCLSAIANNAAMYIVVQRTIHAPAFNSFASQWAFHNCFFQCFKLQSLIKASLTFMSTLLIVISPTPPCYVCPSVPWIHRVVSVFLADTISFHVLFSLPLILGVQWHWPSLHPFYQPCSPFNLRALECASLGAWVTFEITIPLIFQSPHLSILT